MRFIFTTLIAFAIVLRLTPGEAADVTRVSVYVTAGDAAGTFVVHVNASTLPPVPSPVHLDVAKIHVSIVDTHGRTVFGSECFHAADPVTTSSGQIALDAKVSFRVNASPATGMYAAVARVEDGALLDGAGVPLPVRFDRFPGNFYVAAPPQRPPALEIGRRFLAIAADPSVEVEPSAPPFADAAGAPVDVDRIELNPLTLISVDATVPPRALGFSVDGVGVVTLRSEADATHLPGIVALDDDVEVTRLDARFAGKTAWLIGGTSVGCMTSGPVRAFGSLTSDEQVFIEHVYRAHGAPTHFEGIGNLNGLDQSSGFFTPDPIVVVLRVPRTSRFYGGGFSSPGPAAKTFDLHDGCRGFATRVAGAWDFERLFSLQPMAQAYPKWSRTTRTHIIKHEVRRGMTHEMIAWMFGYPPLYGTRADVDSRSTWYYENSPPIAFTVYFEGDRVVRYDPPAGMQ